MLWVGPAVAPLWLCRDPQSSDELRGNGDIVTKAVEQNGSALEYASFTMRNDIELSLLRFSKSTKLHKMGGRVIRGVSVAA